MKAILLILLTVSSFITNAFNSLELNYKMLKAINEYRVSNGLDTLKYDLICDSAAVYHSEYLSKSGLLTHEQYFDVDEFDELDSLNHRFNKAGLLEYNVIGENICVLTEHVPLSLDSIVKLTMEGWKLSKEHNDMLLNKEIKFAAINFSTANFIGKTVILDGDLAYVTEEIPFVYWIVFESRG